MTTAVLYQLQLDSVSDSMFKILGARRLATCPALATSTAQDLVNHVAMDVGESPVEAVVAEREPLVIDAEQMQHGGM